jgi:hypothetical protein
MIAPDLLCSDCGTTAADPLIPGDPCSCGGSFVEVGADVLKALLPLFPENPVFLFRIWKMDNGIPVSLGVSSTCLDRNIIHLFHKAFDQNETVLRIQAVDTNYLEVGKPMLLSIPSGHPDLVAARALEDSIKSLTAGKHTIENA